MRENSTEFEFPTDRNFYVDLRLSYLALILKLVKWRGSATYTARLGKSTQPKIRP